MKKNILILLNHQMVFTKLLFYRIFVMLLIYTLLRILFIAMNISLFSSATKSDILIALLIAEDFMI